MSRTSSIRIKEIFSDAAELSAVEREQYLDSACNGDRELREAVEKLLAASDETISVVDASSVGEFLFGDSAARTLSEGDRVGRFHILRLLGRGGMGEVYEAEDTAFGGRVALKTLRFDFLRKPEFAARFRREIKLARKVTHPNVCRILDVGSHQGLHGEIAYLTMELLEGETLSARLRSGPIPAAEALPLFIQILYGLKALHESGVVHRDLKPANVILVKSPGGVRCVITDFGLAQTSEAAGRPMTPTECLTVAGQLLGTPIYMAPEQLTGNDAGPFSDIYALGIMMYEALCGQRPYEAEQFVRSAAEKLGGPPRSPCQVAALDRRWDALILQCLQTDEKKRPDTAEVLRQLEALATPATAWSGSIRRDALGRIERELRRPGLYRPLSYAAIAAAVMAAAVPVALHFMPAPALRRVCEAFPGHQVVCALPADKGIAVFPFELKGASEQDRAISAGAAHYIRESFNRLAPNPEKMCVHVRPDRIADGVQLIMDGEVETRAGSVTLRAFIREARPQPGRSSGLVLRRFQVRVPRESMRDLHIKAVQEIASALELTYDPAIMRAWAAAAPKTSDLFVTYLEGVGDLEYGQYQRAAQAFNSAIDPSRDFSFAPAHVGLGDAYRLLRNKTGDNTWAVRARQAYQRALSFDQDYGFASAQKRLGELELGFGDPGRAVDQLGAALRLWPDDHLLMKSLAVAQEAAGRGDRAEQVLKAAVERAPNCWLTHNTLADFYARHARYSESEKSMLSVIRLGPDNATAYHNLALIYSRAGRFDDAIEMASKSVRIRPLGLTFSTLGRLLMFRGCHSDGLTNLQKAVQLQPDGFTLWADLSEALNFLRPNTPEAMDATRKAFQLSTQTLERDPGFAYARAEHAIQLARLGQVEQAADEARKALQQAPASHNVLLKVAEALELTGSRSEALGVLQRGFASGLPVYEINSLPAFAKLRSDAEFQGMLKRFRLDRTPDPGGLTPPAPRFCPESNVPGQGLRKV